MIISVTSSTQRNLFSSQVGEKAAAVENPVNVKGHSGSTWLWDAVIREGKN